MKNSLKTPFLCLLGLTLVALCPAATARAQGRDARIISAKAGGVNLVSGGVQFRRAGGREWLSLSTRDDLQSGDAVRTGAGSRVEVLLNPGSYFRAGGLAEFEMSDASLEDLRLRLSRGSAVVEATGYGDSRVSINVVTPQTRVRIVRTGIYRINVLASGLTEVVVQKGRAYVGEGEGTLVKGGKVVRVGAGETEVAKLDKKNRDDLDQWSRERGKELAKANERLSLRQTNAMLARVNFNDYFSAAGRSHGFWLWNTASGCYTFLPFYSGWRSPYGHWYGSRFNSYAYSCGSCPSRSNAGGGYTGVVSNSNSGGQGGTTSGATPSPQSYPTPHQPSPPPMRDTMLREPAPRHAPELDTHRQTVREIQPNR